MSYSYPLPPSHPSKGNSYSLLTVDAVISDVEVRVEIFRTRLSDRVDVRDEHRAVAAAGADVAKVRSDVTVTSSRYAVTSEWQPSA